MKKNRTEQYSSCRSCIHWDEKAESHCACPAETWPIQATHWQIYEYCGKYQENPSRKDDLFRSASI